MLLTAQLLFGVAFLKYAIKVEICPPLIVKYFLKKKFMQSAVLQSTYS